MSISGTLFNAWSGLTTAARRAEVVSQNVANALTEGYGRRSVELSSVGQNGIAAGVRVVAVRRDVDGVTMAERRLAQAEMEGADRQRAALERIEALVGLAGDGDSLSDRVSQFEGALIAAVSRPDSDVRLQAVLTAAGRLAGKINAIGDGIQQIRLEADDDIAARVDEINDTLARIAAINGDIRVQLANGNDANGLMDRRQVLIDTLATQVPLRVVPRELGQVAIFTTGGAVLLDGRAAELGFEAAGALSADMTLESGALSGLTLDGREVAIGDGTGLLSGGALEAAFAVRDVLAPAAMARIDAFARDLAARFDASGLDSTVATGEPGLFTDAGSLVDAANETGLSQRLAVNAAVDPVAGGALWRLRDGLGAAAPGSPGDRALLSGFLDALQQPVSTASGGFSALPRSLADLAGTLTSLGAADRLDAESRTEYARARHEALKSEELNAGVDTDREMQDLLMIEQAYAANARVVSTVDAMLQRLLEI